MPPDAATELAPPVTAPAPPPVAAAPVVAAPAPVAGAPAAAPVAAAPAVAAAPPAPGLQVPGPDAKPEDWKAFYTAIGAPKSGDDYKLELPTGGDPAFAKEAAAAMAEAGLLPKQAEALAKWWNGKSAAAVEAHKATQAAADAKWVTDRAAENQRQKDALTNEWGAANAEANMNLAKQAVAQFFPKDKAGPALLALEDVLGYGGVMRVMHAIGKGLGEGNARGLNGSAGAIDMSPEARAARMYPSSVPKSN